MTNGVNFNQNNIGMSVDINWQRGDNFNTEVSLSTFF